MVSEALKGLLDADWQIGVTEDGLSGRANLKRDLLIYFHTAMCDDHKHTKYVCHSPFFIVTSMCLCFYVPLRWIGCGWCALG